MGKNQLISFQNVLEDTRDSHYHSTGRMKPTDSDEINHRPSVGGAGV